MPDQHAAATEHELLNTIAEPLGQLPEDSIFAVSVDFPIALRGYDRFAVDAYVERTAQIVAELQATRSPEAAVRRALERVGEEISGILQRAHDTADEITSRSRAEAEERLQTARREAVELTAAAAHQVKDLDDETDRIWAERHSIVTDAQELARRLTELAGSAMERFPAAPAANETAAPVPGAGFEIHLEPAEVPAPAHPFDGAVETLDPLGEDEPTVEQTTADHLALEQEPFGEQPALYEEPAVALGDEPSGEDPGGESQRAEPSSTDQPTVDMPPIEPWEGDPGPFELGEA